MRRPQRHRRSAGPTGRARTGRPSENRRRSSAAASALATDGDADLVTKSQVRLQAETRGASSVQFLYNGRRQNGKLTEIDDEDGTRDWSRTVTAKRSDRKPGSRVTCKVRACGDGKCTTTKFSERVEWDD